MDLFAQANLRLCVSLKLAQPGSILGSKCSGLQAKRLTFTTQFLSPIAKSVQNSLPLARTITLGTWDVISKLPRTHAYGILPYVYQLRPDDSTYSKNSHALERAEVPNSIDDTMALINTLGGSSQSPKTAPAALCLKPLTHTCSFSHL